MAAGLALAALPASAAADGPYWHDVAGDVPASVDFADLALSGAEVLAVGHEPGAPGEATDPAPPPPPPTAAIYRRAADGAWQRESLTLPAGCVASQLVDVDASGEAAWAVGSCTDAAGAESALVLRRAAGSWASPAGVPSDLPVSRSVALSGTRGYVGAAGGKLYSIDDAVGFSADAPLQAQSAGAVNAIALTGPGTGFAVADWADSGLGDSDSTARAFELRPAPVPQVADAGASQVDLIAVALSTPTTGVALDRDLTWTRTPTGTWKRETSLSGNFASGHRLRRADSATWTSGSATYAAEAVAGEVPGAGGVATGAIWRRERAAGTSDVAWIADAKVPAGTPPLTSVAVPTRDDLWAVGDDGTVLHYFSDPPVVPQEGGSDESQREITQETAGGAAEQSDAGATQGEPLLESSPVAVSVDQPAAAKPKSRRRKSTRRRSPSRLMRAVRVARAPRSRLVITFKLTRAARVAVTARRAGRVVGRSPSRTMSRGKGRLVLHFTGSRVPTNLKISVRPAAGKAARNG